jgi:hypothetical protein
MRATFDRLAAPLAGVLPDLSAVPNWRQFSGAILISAILHLVVFFTLGVFAQVKPDRVQSPEPLSNALEVELVAAPEEPSDEPVIAKETLPAFDRRGLEESATKPEQAKFQSDVDMVAGSARAGKGLEPLPTQDGLDLPGDEFKTQKGDSTGKPKEVENAGRAESAPRSPTSQLYKPKPLAKQYLEALERINKNGAVAAVPQAEPADAPRIAPVDVTGQSPPLKEVIKPEANEIAVLTQPPTTPVPKPLFAPPRAKPEPIAPVLAGSAKAEEQQMAKLVTPPPRPQPIKEPGYTPDLRPTRIEGSISNRGKAGVDAQRTPLGVYRKAVSKLIESTWLNRTRPEMASLAVGTVRIRFYITQNGHIEDLEVVSNDSNKSFELICEQSVREAKVAPPPADLGVMKDGRLELVFSFTLYDTH